MDTQMMNVLTTLTELRRIERCMSDGEVTKEEIDFFFRNNKTAWAQAQALVEEKEVSIPAHY